jgi:hypothetical protein
MWWFKRFGVAAGFGGDGHSGTRPRHSSTSPARPGHKQELLVPDNYVGTYRSGVY